jgi:hypothetical protein
VIFATEFIEKWALLCKWSKFQCWVYGIEAVTMKCSRAISIARGDAARGFFAVFYEWSLMTSAGRPKFILMIILSLEIIISAIILL